MSYPNPGYGFNLDQQGYPAGPSYPPNLPYPLHPVSPNIQPGYPPLPSESVYPTYPQGYPQYPAMFPQGFTPLGGMSHASAPPGPATYSSVPSEYPAGPSGLPYAEIPSSTEPSGYPSIYPSISNPGPPVPFAQDDQYAGQQNFPFPGTHSNQSGPTAPHQPFPQPVPATASTETPIPTVVAANPFDARQDADRLHAAFKGFGSDKDAIINILCRRTSIQRIQIVSSYKSAFGKDLTKRLISELSGDLEKVMVALTTPLFEFLANELHHSMAGVGTRESVLIEVLCPATNFEIQAIKSAYQQRYNRSLESDIRGDTSGHFQRILVALIQGMRDEGSQTYPEQAINDARRLFSAGEGRLGTEESTFISILATRSWAQLRLVMSEYSKIAKSTLEAAVTGEFSGDIQKSLLTILRCATNRYGFLATCLRACTAGLGTRDRDLIRLIVSHCDTDLGSIKREYRLLFHKDLSADVADDTSGHYQKALLTLIGV